MLVSPEWIREVSWSDSRVYVEMTRNGVQSAPEYDPSRPLERDYESNLYRHYGRRNYYWEYRRVVKQRKAPPAAMCRRGLFV